MISINMLHDSTLNKIIANAKDIAKETQSHSRSCLPFSDQTVTDDIDPRALLVDDESDSEDDD